MEKTKFVKTKTQTSFTCLGLVSKSHYRLFLVVFIRNIQVVNS